MKIGILADIHGNSIALEAVLQEAKHLQITRLLVLGDIVGYYYHPDKVLELLKGFETTMIRGNHEDMLRSAKSSVEEEEKIKLKHGSGISIALNTLTGDQIKNLTDLPTSTTVTLDSCTIMLCHGAPWKSDEYIYPDAPKEVLAKCTSVKADFLLLGHTHHPFIHSRNSVTVLNPGSVGQPRDIGNLASWAILDTANASIVFKRAQFDIEPLIEEAKKNDPGIPYLQEIFRR